MLSHEKCTNFCDESMRVSCEQMLITNLVRVCGCMLFIYSELILCVEEIKCVEVSFL